MRITIQITCDDVEDAQRVMKKLAVPDNTWVDQVSREKTVFTPPINTKHLDDAKEARLDKIMGSSAKGAEQSGSNDGATDAPRPNIDPGPPSIGKIGGETKDKIFAALNDGPFTPSAAGKWAEHLKLLWKRGEIKYDGTEYYL